MNYSYSEFILLKEVLLRTEALEYLSDKLQSFLNENKKAIVLWYMMCPQKLQYCTSLTRLILA